jgi:hypothetical protein
MSDKAAAVMTPYRIIIGATLLPALKAKAGRFLHPNRQSGANSQRQLEVFPDFFIHCASPTGGE